MSLLELIAAADERGLAASAVACLDRCLPQPAEDSDPDPLRPLRAGCADGSGWPDRLADVRAALEELLEAADDTSALSRKLLDAAPRDFSAVPLRAWADACSLAALEIHCRFDAQGGDGEADSEDRTELLNRCRAEGPEGAGPLLAGELRRQIQILETLAETTGTVGSGAALRRVLDLSTEGRRVLRAAVSRQARGRA
ncbi:MULTISPECIES: hypothetical protein [unclassified Streptomyces]|uniref:hypothetical protein n=1 Tax=unclassified Streptomyces TaxID=2593676 RepID=UPI00225369F4|nr:MULTISPECIES: hypothetical protein [unclassified Streptomyces]WSP57050.1 hypothetical protein OG306_23745 [Streptomyces sp. NBC_01241]WSU22232.1 hypothetical protein OG508_15485 [Streptomyces sp. NBC_01108]MCX4788845.1 hypothetical protein [Streptomyces sp. NBC_01221]WSJ36705.1 hypothetical protein OG772_12100 [Streptomyces sp. NBC_01321]WSP63122.1 hypothetical protein OG466_15400 [Streptomyces sp. NBC_01240]